MIDLDSINKLLDKKLISKNTYKHIKKIIDMFGHNNNLKLLKIDNNKIYVKVGNTVYYYCKFKNNGMQYCLNGYNNTLITSLGYIDILHFNLPTWKNVARSSNSHHVSRICLQPVRHFACYRPLG